MEILPDIEPNPELVKRLKRKKLVRFIYWAALIVVALASGGAIYKAAWYGEPKIDDRSYCGLDVVFCEGEVLEVNSEPHTAIITAYTSRPEETDGSPCIAADNSNICERYRLGELICASNAYPIGTQLLIDGYGVCTVADRMNRRFEDRIDIYFGFDVNSAYEWGVREVYVKKL